MFQNNYSGNHLKLTLKFSLYSLGTPFVLKPLSANITKWSSKLKQFVDKLPTNCLSVFDNFVGLVLKGLINPFLGQCSLSYTPQKPAVFSSFQGVQKGYIDLTLIKRDSWLSLVFCFFTKVFPYKGPLQMFGRFLNMPLTCEQLLLKNLFSREISRKIYKQSFS